MAQSYTSPSSMSQPPSSPPLQQVPEGIEPSGISKDHRISADQAEPSAQNADTDLCPRCFSIEPKIQELLSMDPKSLRNVQHSYIVFEFKSADDIVRSPGCPLCQALEFICPKIWLTHQRCPARLVVVEISGSSFDDVPSDDSAENEHEDNGRSNQEDTQHLCLTLTYTDPLYRNLNSIDMFNAGAPAWIQDAVGYMAEKPALERNPRTGFANYLPALVDFKLLKEWLEFSEREGNLIEGTNSVQRLMVIDCESGEIIEAPSTKYVALSYVWGQGKPKEGELEEKEGRLYLKRPLEKTIEDAITVTQQLDLRYLWIDRYCIPPDNFEHQISKMHEIYGGAHVTIIAAAGNGPQHGLPGVNQTRRTGPTPVKIGSRTLLATFPSPKLPVEGSKWYSRGWTFQEGLLSRRRLVFTDHQVFFHYDNSVFFEASSNYLPSGVDPRRGVTPSIGSLFSFTSARQSGQGAPWDRITQYCTLDLTNPEDMVNAILGVLNYYQEGNHGKSTITGGRDHRKIVAIRHITGLPILKREYWPSGRYELWEDTIICALFWKSKTPGDRLKPERMQFPSWSWAGWKCDCYFGNSMAWLEWDDGAPDLRSFDGSFESLRTQNGYLPSILIETEEPESLLQATEYETMFDEMHDFSKIRYLHITALTIDARIVTYDDRLEERDNYLYLENTGRRLALECSGAEKLACLNLTSNSIYRQPVPLFGHPCLAIILDDDPYTERTRYYCSQACLLVVDKTEDCYERIGVAQIRREALRKAHVKKQEDIKLG